MAVSSRAADRLWAGAIAIAAFAVYLGTLAPGLIAIVDTPAFQFVGRVLGVPHNPGYPAYVLLTHAFAYLPIGSLAYRMNLFSALCGAAAASGTYPLCRGLGCRPATSAASALGLAFGRVFWSQAVIAEVYTLNAAIIAAMIAVLVAWGHTRRPGQLYAAVALLALGLGNHTTIILLVPGMIVFALATDARFSLRPRTLLFVLTMAGVALGQYGFILVRSRTPGAYVESPAATIADLAGVIAGRQFSEGLFAFPAHTVIMQRVPALLTGVLVPELTIGGAILAAVGLWGLARRRPAMAALLGGGAALVFGFAANYDAVDIYVFLIPVFGLLWPCAALGAETLLARLPARAARTAAVLLLVAVAAVQLRRNYGANDLSHEWRDAVYFTHLFEGLPDRTVIVKEDFLVDRMVMYELLGERAGAGRRLRVEAMDRGRVLAAIDNGETVLAFPKSAERLRDAGLDVSYAPRLVLGEPLRKTLNRLASGFKAVTGSAVEVNGRELLQTSDGTAAVILGPDGAVRDMFVAEPGTGFRVPIQPPPLLLYEVRGVRTGAPDLTGLLRYLDRRSEVLRMARDEQSLLIGDGWSAVEADAAGPYRRTAAPNAHLMLPLARIPIAVHIVASPSRGGTVLGVSLNGYDLGERPLAGGWHGYDWVVPDHVAHARNNQTVIVTGPGTAPVAISSVTIRYAR